MPEKRTSDFALVQIGRMFESKRKALGKQYRSRERFIDERSMELFNGEQWISLRHLYNIEHGKNWISVEKLIALSYALDEDPVNVFEEIVNIYHCSMRRV